MPERTEIVTQSAEETLARGQELAATIQAPLLVLLSGELGSGKTTLAKGIISGLGAAREEDVTSPTFTLVHVFRRSGENEGKVYHVDLYRVANFHDLETLGLEDVLTEPGILLVEWSERFRLRSDWPRLAIHLEHLEGNSRRIVIEREGP